MRKLLLLTFAFVLSMGAKGAGLPAPLSQESSQEGDLTGQLIKLPFLLAGTDTYTAGQPLTMELYGEQTLLYELRGAADEGHIYYDAASQTLLFDNAVIDHRRTYYAVKAEKEALTVVVRGHNSITTKGTAIMTGGDLIIIGEGTASSSLTLTGLTGMGTQTNYGLFAAGNMTLSDLTLRAENFCYTFYGIEPGNTPVTLRLQRVAADITTLGVRPSVVRNFAEVLFEQCEPSPELHAGAAIAYVNRELKQGDDRCAELHLVAETADDAASSDEPVSTEEPATEEPVTAYEGEIFARVDQYPSFPGGQEAMQQFLTEHMRYPVIARENGVQGRVMLSFVVEPDGVVDEINVLRGVDPALDKEAIRLIKAMPRWNPGILGDQPVRVSYTFPVVFRLK